MSSRIADWDELQIPRRRKEGFFSRWPRGPGKRAEEKSAPTPLKMTNCITARTERILVLAASIGSNFQQNI
jgi:hypothetical protein